MRAAWVPFTGPISPRLQAGIRALIEKGDVAGHEFHGNQWQDGGGGMTDRGMLARTIKNQGLTYQPHTHESPKPGDNVFSVSAYPERGTNHTVKQTTPAMLHKFIEKNADLLDDPKNSFGTWHDKVSGRIFLDVVVLTKSRASAIKIGMKHNQIAAFSFKTMSEVSIKPEARARYVKQDGSESGGLHADDGRGGEEARKRAEVVRADLGAPGDGGGDRGTDGAAADAAEDGVAKGDVVGHEFHGNQWTEGGGDGKPDAQGRYHVEGNLDLAVKLVGEGKDVVLDQPREVAVFMDRLAAIGKEAQSGEKKVYDLCHVSVQNTNLFCAGSMGIARLDMPQLSGKPTPGSRGDALPKDKKGEIDLNDQFAHHLGKNDGVSKEKEDPAYLRPSQRELDGVKVAAIMAKMAAGEMKDRRIWVTKDNYIIDGHHYWAAAVASEYASGKSMSIKVYRTGTTVIPALKEANAFAAKWGIAQRAVGKALVCGI